MLGDVDADGALAEAFVGVGLTRVELLAGAGAGIGSAVLLGALAAPARAARGKAQDVQILNFALTLEYLQASFYTETERAGVVAKKPRLARIPPLLGAVERAHVRAIKKVLGSDAVERPFFDFRGVTEDPGAFLRTAVAFEDLAVSAYKGQATRISSPNLLAAAVAIHSVEARHAAWMRYLVGISPAARAFDPPATQEKAQRLVASTHFVVSRPQRRSKARPRYTG
jgi:hypothetical protein